MEYDIFISYRRDGGWGLASLLNAKLHDKGYKVFFDLESMKAGKKFNEQLYEKIEQCKVFLLVLPPNALDRCVNKGDWVRNEILKAMELHKPVIPVMMPGFNFPERLPKAMKDLRFYHGITASDELFEMVLEKLCGMIDECMGEERNKPDKSFNAPVDMRNIQAFANCGKEGSIFKIKKSREGDEIILSVNFEKTRLRDEIPDFAGVYYILVPARDIRNNRSIKLEMCSPDNTIETVWVELKPKGKAWMHEAFDFELTPEYETFTIDTEDFMYKETLKCLEEITIVFKPESFADENNLSGKILLRNISIE